MKWFFIIILFPSIAFALSPGDQLRAHISTYEGYKRDEERFDRFVIACLQTYDNRERNYNDEWHKELELKSIQCADRLETIIDERNYGPYEKQEKK